MNDFKTACEIINKLVTSDNELKIQIPETIINRLSIKIDKTGVTMTESMSGRSMKIKGENPEIERRYLKRFYL